MSEPQYLNEAKLLPILQFTERLMKVITEYKRTINLEIKYDSTRKEVSYILDVDLQLGKYQAVLSVTYDENEEGVTNDWAELKSQVNHIEEVINA